MAKSGTVWCEGPYGKRGPLTPAEVDTLAGEFGFEPADIRRLSASLGQALDPRVRPKGIADPARAAKKAIDELLALQADVRAALRKVRQADRRLGQLWIRDREKTSSAEKLEYVLIDGLVTAERELQYMDRMIDLRAKSDCGTIDILFRGAPGRGRGRDLLRYAVLSALFEVWARAGRPLSYTTNPGTNARTGPLIAFVNAVIPLVTEHKVQLSPETIKSDLEEFRAANPGIVAALGQV